MGFQNSTVFLERETVYVERERWNVLRNNRSGNTNELCSILFMKRSSRKYRDSSVEQSETPVDGIKRDASRGFVLQEQFRFPRRLRMNSKSKFHPANVIDNAGNEGTHRHRGNDQKILRFPSNLHEHQKLLRFQVFRFGGKIGVAGVSAVEGKKASTSPPNPGPFSRLFFPLAMARAPSHSDSRGSGVTEPPVLAIGGNAD